MRPSTGSDAVGQVPVRVVQGFRSNVPNVEVIMNLRTTGARAGPLLPLFTLSLLAGCNGDEGPMDPPPTASITVTSPIGDQLATDHSVQLEAVAYDATGGALSGRSFSWSSSAPSVASVDAVGLVEGLDAGPATVSASADGVDGGLSMRIVDVDEAGIGALLDDAYTQELVARLSDPSRGGVEDSLQECATALDQGGVRDLTDCLDDVASGTSTDPTDRALLGVLSLMAIRSTQLIELPTS